MSPRPGLKKNWRNVATLLQNLANDIINLKMSVTFKSQLDYIIFSCGGSLRGSTSSDPKFDSWWERGFFSPLIFPVSLSISSASLDRYLIQVQHNYFSTFHPKIEGSAVQLEAKQAKKMHGMSEKICYANFLIDRVLDLVGVSLLCHCL